MWSTPNIIETFTRFFRERGHQQIAGHSLIPPDPHDSVLFVTSGMHPLVPYLNGQPHPRGRELTDVQRCLRTTDLQEVGDDTHLTVFQMLGSWSLGSYLGPTSLRYGYELLTDGFGISPQRLAVTVFAGDDRCEPDAESERVWKQLGLEDWQIHRLGRQDNWWGPNGPCGPCGPCGPDSEMFVWMGDGSPDRDLSSPDWMEVWNHVLLRYQQDPRGKLSPLTQHNVDTGMGLERLSMVLQGVRSVYQTDIFEPWMTSMARLTGLDGRPLRVACDHLRSLVVLSGDGVRPSNTGRGYVMRRLLRRTLHELHRASASEVMLSQLPSALVQHTEALFNVDVPERLFRKTLDDEQRRYEQMLRRGERDVQRLIRRKSLGPDSMKYLRDTHGLPADVVVQILEDLRMTRP